MPLLPHGQVGGKLGNVFDEDPKRWRMVAEAFLTLGLALEIATAFSPSNFIALAGAGNLSRAVGRGMTNPCFRIIQTHFAAANNIGDVAAKEEVCNSSWLLLIEDPSAGGYAHRKICCSVATYHLQACASCTQWGRVISSSPAHL